MRRCRLVFAVVLMGAVLGNAGESAAQIPGHDNPPIAYEVGEWRFALGGFFQTGFEALGVDGDTIPEGSDEPHVGFLNLNARLNFDLSYAKRLSVRLGLDGVANIETGGRTRQAFELKDAYVDFKAHAAARLRLGQFKPPLDLENMISETASNFARRSVVSTGGTREMMNRTVLNGGFSPGRQLGFSVYSDILEIEHVGFRYHLAVTNGNRATEVFNDDGHLAFYGRVEALLMRSLLGDFRPGHFLSFAAGVAYGKTALNLTDAEGGALRASGRQVTVSGDVRLDYAGVAVDVEALWRRYEHADVTHGIMDIDRLGVLAQAAYTLPITHWRFQLGYRFAMLKPLLAGGKDLVASDLRQHTVALGYFFENFPLTVRLEYTHNDEDDIVVNGVPRSLSNDSVLAMVQVVW
ncbi:MAG: OprO/OprP family phosphate-selective porin [Proteobacteria bacterium]|nr:OprO/OprP family phosphate-selective porin [Pseudomonadota bacterium]